MKRAILLGALLLPGAVLAQGNAGSGLSYSYVELRFVDVDENGGDGFRLNGSLEAGSNWLILAGITNLDFNQNVEQTIYEIGGGYVYPFRSGFDLLANLRYLNSDVDTPGVGFDDNGFAIAAGTRGLIAPNFEVRGLVNHVNLDNSDTYFEFGADYFFLPQISAGLTLEFGGDTDVWTLGARWFFR